MSAMRALQGFETETRELLEGTKENSVTPDNLPFRQINDFSFKKELEKNCDSGRPSCTSVGGAGGHHVIMQRRDDTLGPSSGCGIHVTSPAAPVDQA